MLNYRIYGDFSCDRTPLVVLHGLLGSLDNWHTFATRQQEKRPIVAIDLRNHGESPHVLDMNYHLMMADVLEVAEHLNMSQFDLMGHSMGGKVAMNLALHHPARLDHLIVVDIAPVQSSATHHDLLQAMLAMQLDTFTSRREADQALAPTVKQPFERAFLLKNLKRTEEGTFEWQCYLSEIAKNYPNLTAFPDEGLTYQDKALFIGGAQSDYLSPERWAVAQQMFPKAQLIMIPEAGHLPHVQTPEIFTQHVMQHLGA
ncbi:alpha/beta fold hydrolase [Thiolinea disciformis]|uniref:alpha/beta fold hydrolase n=1 Tax=Thiolinea disciformis TaxID=125614 RepID=UPI00037A42AE|nr:alpha/beta fold hydrolase [Thiolinea disciformis]